MRQLFSSRRHSICINWAGVGGALQGLGATPASMANWLALLVFVDARPLRFAATHSYHSVPSLLASATILRGPCAAVAAGVSLTAVPPESLEFVLLWANIKVGCRSHQRWRPDRKARRRRVLTCHIFREGLLAQGQKGPSKAPPKVIVRH